jgi:putative DNA primase/helicase
MNNKSIERGQTFLDEHTAKSNNNAAAFTKEMNNKYDRTRVQQKQTSGFITPLSIPVIERAPGKVEAVGGDSSPSIDAGGVEVLPENIAQPDTPPAQSVDETIQWLASLKPHEYDRVRKEWAATLEMRAATLDELVKTAHSDGSKAERLPFDEIEPHPGPIDPAQLLDEVSATIRQFIVLDDHQADAAALWVVLTHFIDVVEVAPLLIVNAPEKSCGKTQLLTVMGYMAYRPLPASNASASALFRAVELWKPTILIDEADTFFRDNTELHGMVNAGYLRNGYVLRSEAVGDSFEPRTFSVFSAKALAGIALERHLPDATMSRGIVLNLRRKLPDESVSRLRHADRGLFSIIAEKMARFALDFSKQVRLARPVLPNELSDRDQDNWDGLLAIASCAGDMWLARATKAALKLSGAGEKTVSTGNELLADIQHVFERKRVDKINFADLIQALCDDEEAGWATYNRGKPITPRQVSKRLKEYGISSKPTRFGYDGVQKGFDADQFSDAFARYLKNTDFPVTQLQPNNGDTFDVTNGEDVTVTQSIPVTPKPSNSAACNHVTEKTPILGGTEASLTPVSHLRI